MLNLINLSAPTFMKTCMIFAPPFFSCTMQAASVLLRSGRLWGSGSMPFHEVLKYTYKLKTNNIKIKI